MLWLHSGDLSVDKEYIYGDIEITRASREPCLVCGHPTGDCSDDSAAPHHIFGADSVIQTVKSSQMILVEETIYGEKQISPFTTAKVILAAKGTYVTLEKAKELGIA